MEYMQSKQADGRLRYAQVQIKKKTMKAFFIAFSLGLAESLNLSL